MNNFFIRFQTVSYHLLSSANFKVFNSIFQNDIFNFNILIYFQFNYVQIILYNFDFWLRNFVSCYFCCYFVLTFWNWAKIRPDTYWEPQVFQFLEHDGGVDVGSLVKHGSIVLQNYELVLESRIDLKAEFRFERIDKSRAYVSSVVATRSWVFVLLNCFRFKIHIKGVLFFHPMTLNPFNVSPIFNPV